ncbi:hypothetical protein CDV55_103798 [Aspergillus turcosus]|uniref:Uncharacterized protein n=1 Tax=Aspergillus turcosus TaxID=1245748 RepID=A0A229XMK7_9EURO|nr:hypothetical protein CDV55_103798 [Aspergillus turcosus]RLM01942.1 hypothetical protein CFD26_108553 [Aspergillus turcosus]
MGFLELIPADELKATYDGQDLILSAQGQVQDHTTGITFSRQPYAGFFRFELEGWVGPLHDSHSKYKHEQRFKIHLVPPYGYIDIVDQNNPNGRFVKIDGINEKRAGAHSKKSASVEAGQGAGPTPTKPEFLLPEDVQLTEIVHRPFQIKENMEASNRGTINVKFDTKFVHLKTASIANGNIVWEFDPLKTGKTQVVVIAYGGITPYVLRQSYEITVLPGVKDANSDA